MKTLLFTLAASTLLAAQPALAQGTATSGKTEASVTTQLPRTTRPNRYDITITPDAAKLAFTGRVRTGFSVLSSWAAGTTTDAHP